MMMTTTRRRRRRQRHWRRRLLLLHSAVSATVTSCHGFGLSGRSTTRQRRRRHSLFALKDYTTDISANNNDNGNGSHQDDDDDFGRQEEDPWISKLEPDPRIRWNPPPSSPPRRHRHRSPDVTTRDATTTRQHDRDDDSFTKERQLQRHELFQRRKRYEQRVYGDDDDDADELVSRIQPDARIRDWQRPTTPRRHYPRQSDAVNDDDGDDDDAVNVWSEYMTISSEEPTTTTTTSEEQATATASTALSHNHRNRLAPPQPASPTVHEYAWAELLDRLRHDDGSSSYYYDMASPLHFDVYMNVRDDEAEPVWFMNQRIQTVADTVIWDAEATTVVTMEPHDDDDDETISDDDSTPPPPPQQQQQQQQQPPLTMKDLAEQYHDAESRNDDLQEPRPTLRGRRTPPPTFAEDDVLDEYNGLDTDGSYDLPHDESFLPTATTTADTGGASTVTMKDLAAQYDRGHGTKDSREYTGDGPFTESSPPSSEPKGRGSTGQRPGVTMKQLAERYGNSNSDDAPVTSHETPAAHTTTKGGAVRRSTTTVRQRLPTTDTTNNDFGIGSSDREVQPERPLTMKELAENYHRQQDHHHQKQQQQSSTKRWQARQGKSSSPSRTDWSPNVNNMAKQWKVRMTQPQRSAKRPQVVEPTMKDLVEAYRRRHHHDRILDGGGDDDEEERVMRKLALQELTRTHASSIQELATAWTVFERLQHQDQSSSFAPSMEELAETWVRMTYNPPDA